MNTRFAGGYLFFSALEKPGVAKVHLWRYVGIYMGRPKKSASEKVTKPGVSLDPECREILERIIAYEMREHANDMTPSQAIRSCIRQAWRLHYHKLEEGKSWPVAGANQLRASESSDSLSSTRMKKPSRKAG